MRAILNFLLTAGFVALLPIFLAASYIHGSRDEQLLMRWAVIIFGSPCAVLWYVAISNFVFHRRASFIVQCVLFIMGYGLVGLMIHTGVLSLAR